MRNNLNTKNFFNEEIAGNFLYIDFDFNITGSWEQIKITGNRKSGGRFKVPANFMASGECKRIFKSMFSDVEINFTPQTIQNVTSKNIDVESNESVRSNNNLATEITQLLIDVQSIDALEFTEWARSNTGLQVDEDRIDVRIKRFTNAFHFIFPNKRYKKIVNLSNRKEVIFEENGREMTIDKLSSGEKQIVFRGGFLLKDKESSKGALIFIDEPEISLHPLWQLRILNYFKKLFTNNDGVQTSQIIVTTHSPFIIHNANRVDDKVIVLIRDKQGKTVVSQNPKFYAWSNEKAVEQAFNVSHVLNNHKMTVFVEGETDEKYFNKCMSVFDIPTEEIEFKWIGRVNEKGNTENTGDSALNQAKTFFCANMDIIKGTVVLLYDSDTKKPEEDIESLLIRRMKINTMNAQFKIGIENLLVIPNNSEVKATYKERVKTDDYGAVSVIRELDKAKLCADVCDHIGIEQQKVIFRNVLEEINRLLNYKLRSTN